MFHYMRENHGDWLAVPHGSLECQSLSSMFGVRGIPALIMVTHTGEVVTRDGRQEVMSLGVSAMTTWSQATPQHVDTSVVSMLVDNKDHVMEAAKEVLSSIINDPNNTKYRTVKMSNKVIIEKLLPA